MYTSREAVLTHGEEVIMGRRATRRQRARERRLQESRPAPRRISRMTWLTGLAVGLLGLVAGGIFYGSSQSSDQAPLSTNAGLDVGSDVGDQVPEFDLRLVDGSTVNSAELVSAEKPVFYFFFATW